MASAGQSVTPALERAIWVEARLTAASNLLVSASMSTAPRSAVRKDIGCALAEVDLALVRTRKTIARERGRR